VIFLVIIEGIDGTGKSTICEYLSDLGYNVHHLKYEEKNEKGFLNFLEGDTSKLVLDRCFVTELVYGPILRNGSKINPIQTANIINNYSKIDCRIIYLKALKLDLLKRRASHLEDLEMLEKYYEVLNNKYDEIIDSLEDQFSILTINTSLTSIDETHKKVKKFLE